MLSISSISLLEVDATLVAGAIILLTITSFVGEKLHEPILIPIGKGRHFALTPHQVASGVIVGFGGSGVIIMGSNSQVAPDLSIIFAWAGFIYLVFSAIVIAGKEQFGQTKGVAR